MRAFILTFLAGLVAIVLLIGWRRDHELRALRQSADVLARGNEALRVRVEEAEAQLEPLRRRFETERLAQGEATARAARGAADLAEFTSANADWSTPPEMLPDWNPQSPYVWLEKSILPKFPIRAFGMEGELQPDIAAVLTVEPEQLKLLNRRLTELVAGVRAAEVAHAAPVPEHLPSVARESGPKLTIRVEPIPEESQRAKDAFAAVLRESLGGQRADLLLEASEGWISEAFNAGGTEPRIYSVARLPDDTYVYSVKSGAGGMSMSGASSIDDYLPAHLRPLFAAITTSPAKGTSGSGESGPEMPPTRPR